MNQMILNNSLHFLNKVKKTKTMIELTKDSTSPVGELGIFTQADFFSKNKNAPLKYKYDERIILAYELLFQILRPKFGEKKAKPFFRAGTTMRFPSDSNYYVDNDLIRKKRSMHSYGKAGDGNWRDSEVEKYIIRVLGYSLHTQSPLAKKLRDIGINGFGTYFITGNGTFIHLDTGDKFNHYRKLPKGELEQARIDHDDLMSYPEVQMLLDVVITPNPSLPIPVTSSMYDYADYNVGNTVLFFSASWCGVCENIKQARTPIQASLIPNIKERNIDVSEQNAADLEISARYDVTVLPSFIFLKDGKIINRMDGLSTDEQIRKAIIEHNDYAPGVVSNVKETAKSTITTVTDNAKKVNDLFKPTQEDGLSTIGEILKWTIVGVGIITVLALGWLAVKSRGW